MPINANTFNSRVTSEALEKKFRDVFPAQGGAELIQDLYAAGTIQPVIDFSSVAEGSALSQNLQTAWDFATDFTSWNDTNSGTLVNTPGFWKVDIIAHAEASTSVNGNVTLLAITDGLSSNTIWALPFNNSAGASAVTTVTAEQSFVVFLRSGDSLTYNSPLAVNSQTSAWYRQIADVNGTLVNPLGFTFS